MTKVKVNCPHVVHTPSFSWCNYKDRYYDEKYADIQCKPDTCYILSQTRCPACSKVNDLNKESPT